jgi:(S)-3,5-dihydroxyphenylglycine transaminase
VSDAELFYCAENYGVICTPMSYFYVGDVVSSSVRLSYSYVNDAQIVEGVRRFSRFVREQESKINL